MGQLLISVALASLGSLFCHYSHALTFDTNIPDEIQSQVKHDLAFLAEIRGSNASSLHKEIFGDVSGANYLSFLNFRIQGIGLSDCRNQEAMACVNPLEDPTKMWMTPNYIHFHHPMISRIMTIFHEARHTEKDHKFWPHSRCPNVFQNQDKKLIQSIWTGTPLSGRSACDHTAYGSYGTSIVLLKNISRYCMNCSSKVKLDAAIYADDQLNRITLSKAHAQIVSDND